MSLKALMDKIGAQRADAATFATPATHQASEARTVARVATVAVAAPLDPKSQIAAWRASIEAVPAPCNRDGERLLNSSLTFLASEQAAELLSCGSHQGARQAQAQLNAGAR